MPAQCHHHNFPDKVSRAVIYRQNQKTPALTTIYRRLANIACIVQFISTRLQEIDYVNILDFFLEKPLIKTFQS